MGFCNGMEQGLIPFDGNQNQKQADQQNNAHTSPNDSGTNFWVMQAWVIQKSVKLAMRDIVFQDSDTQAEIPLYRIPSTKKPLNIQIGDITFAQTDPTQAVDYNNINVNSI